MNTYRLYNRQFQVIGTNAFVIESWKKITRAFETDSIQFVGEVPNIDITSALFATVHDKFGNVLFGGLLSTPDSSNKTDKATIYLKDFITMFNTEIVIDMTAYATVDALITAMFGLATETGITINLDITGINAINLDYAKDTTTINIKETIFELCKQYNLYYEANIDLINNRLNISFKKVGTATLDINLSEWDLKVTAQDFGIINKATVLSEIDAVEAVYYLCNDNVIRVAPSEEQKLYPIKNKNFIGEDREYNAITILAENRYQENFDINVVDTQLQDYGFNTLLTLYVNGIIYKQLPIGEIEEDSNGTKIIRIGYRPRLFTQIRSN
jgi:hypothetical protein